MLSKEYYLNELKGRLYNEVARYIKMQHDLPIKETGYASLKELNMLFSDSNIYEIYDNRYQVSALLELIYDKNSYEKIYNKFTEVLYSYFDNSGNPTIPDEEIYKKLLAIRDVIYEEYIKEAKFIRDYQNEVVKGRFLIKRFKQIHYCLKENKFIKYDLISAVKQYMQENNYSSQKQILVLEAIEAHNKKVRRHLDEMPKSYVEKMINTYLRKFDIPEEVEFELYDEYYPQALSYYKIINEIKVDEINAYLDYLPKADEKMNVEKFKYVYLTFLNMLIDDVYQSIDDVSDLEIYNDRELVNMACDNYSEALKKYYVVFNLFKQELVKYNEDIKEYEEQDDFEEQQDDNGYVNKLVYLSSNGVSTLEKDLKNINKEYYDRVYSLLERKKRGTLTSKKDSIMKSINDKLAGFGKLEEDQVRIMYKPLGNNVYLIIGGFVKKATRDLSGYLTLSNEYNNTDIPPVEELLAEAPALEESLLTYINNNKRRQDR